MQGGDLDLEAPSTLQAAERSYCSYMELEEEYVSLRAAALSLERKEQLTIRYQPMIDKGALS